MKNSSITPVAISLGTLAGSAVILTSINNNYQIDAPATFSQALNGLVTLAVAGVMVRSSYEAVCKPISKVVDLTVSSEYADISKAALFTGVACLPMQRILPDWTANPNSLVNPIGLSMDCAKVTAFLGVVWFGGKYVFNGLSSKKPESK